MDGGGLQELDRIQRLVKAGLKRTESLRTGVYDSLARYILADGTVDGDVILRDYFPAVKADFFISHSHDDTELAIAFSQWLYENFHIEAFVDHNIWGSGDKLIRKLDDEYCFKTETKSYDYMTRNLTTSFVHLMLASVISKMIESCDYLIFLNSPNSLSADPRDNTTGSPWIFYELLMAKLLEEKNPKRKQFSQGGTIMEGGNISFIVKQTPQIDFLDTITIPILKSWKKCSKGESAKESLRMLYNLV